MNRNGLFHLLSHSRQFAYHLVPSGTTMLCDSYAKLQRNRMRSFSTLLLFQLDFLLKSQSHIGRSLVSDFQQTPRCGIHDAYQLLSYIVPLTGIQLVSLIMMKTTLVQDICQRCVFIGGGGGNTRGPLIHPGGVRPDITLILYLAYRPKQLAKVSQLT